MLRSFRFVSMPLVWLLSSQLLGLSSVAVAAAGLCKADASGDASIQGPTLARAVAADRMIAAEAASAEVSSDDEVFDFSAFFLDEPAPRSNSKSRVKKTEAGSTSVGCRNCSAAKAAQKLSDNLSDLRKTVPEHALGAATADSTAAALLRKNRARASRILPEPAPEPKYTTTNPDEETWKQFPDIYQYSQSNQVKKTLAYALHPPHKTVPNKSTGWCYASVKNALVWGGKLTNNRLVGNPVFPEISSSVKKRFGHNAVTNLKNEGFINLMEDPRTKALIKDPASAPKGAVLIYKGGHNGGHIEIKTDYGARGSYVSDFKNSYSVLGNELAGRTSAHYQLVAVMVKSPMESGE